MTLPVSGEPVFTLRAQDKFAPAVVEWWADCVEAHLHNSLSDAGGPVDRGRRKIVEARALAHTMRAWQVLNNCKVPD